ncbi:hypothetical protein ACWGRK_12520 [Saccharomonospora azurea]|uniref:Uncharacterized protein n=1 Tax=Saccharomonospora azurea NA-128 TaxID=882081 RepID=H8G8B4_9PSEU|nr:hypothetical protein [Saccharomonospora azurea]EHY90436.1 hypothetical protein SacazDRAFT_03568 [Saccharomonospora azurea NA-128]
MTIYMQNGIAGTPLSGFDHVARRCGHVTVSRYAQQNEGTRVRVGVVPVSPAVAGVVDGGNTAVRRMTADLPQQFWVPLCPQESVP